MARPAGPAVAVVGGGVIGLTTALRLREAGFAVDVFADRPLPETTSAVAAALWYPYCAAPPERVLAWAASTYRTFSEQARAGWEGVRMVEMVELFDAPAPPPWWAPALPAEALRESAPPAGFADAHRAAVPLVETPLFLPALRARVEAAGARFFTRYVASLDALFDTYPVVVCAAGLRARFLTGDDTLHPVRGQVVLVRRPPGLPDTLVLYDTPTAITYVVPRTDDVLLGGTADEGAWDLTPDPAVAEAICARAARLVPALAEAPVLAHRIGLRPGRPAVRLELEARPGGLLVHHYGHGGSGYTLCWGCADEVAARLQAHGVQP